MIWYPSIGNSEYPYTTWMEKRPDTVWIMLGLLSEMYDNISRSLRNIYKWSPETIDGMDFNRLLKVFNETKEDQEEKAEGLED